MPKRNEDWLTDKSLAEQDLMFETVEENIPGFKASFGLTDDWIASVVILCQMFREMYAKVMQNRAKAEQMNKWFELVLNTAPGAPQGSPVPAAPVFEIFTMPGGSTVGLYPAFRQKIEFFKANEAYNHAIGEGLMIVADKSAGKDPATSFPTFKFSQDANENVVAKYIKGGFSGSELQWREVGQTEWKLADKSDQSVIIFKPQVSTPGQPVQIELRGIYILKNQRVGLWSPIYTMTIG